MKGRNTNLDFPKEKSAHLFRGVSQWLQKILLSKPTFWDRNRNLSTLASPSRRPNGGIGVGGGTRKPVDDCADWPAISKPADVGVQLILPDVLAPGLRIVFCGTAAGNVSAAAGCYYAHPQNKFWRTLEAIGLTPHRLHPPEFATLPRWGLGLTDIAKSVSGMDKQLPPGALGREPCRTMAAKIAAAQPAILAFTSLTAGRRYLGRDAGFGEQPETIGATRIWLLPSPSPAANWNWEEGWWRALAATALSSPSP